MKIGVVGSGLVGATAAYAVVMRGVAGEVVLVDARPERAAAEANDIQHAVPFANPVRVCSGTYADLAGADIVVIAAGVAQRPGESRGGLLGRNSAVFADVIPQALEAAGDCVLLIATNPVDVMTHFAARLAAQRGVEPGRVLGTGTLLDTARFRSLLSEELGVDSQNVHAYVVGEHGDSEVLTWSAATVAGVPLDEFCRLQGMDLTAEERRRIDARVRGAAASIIEGKGATYYGVGGAIARIVEAVLRDQRSVLTVCSPIPEVAGVRDVTLSLPHIIGGKGVQQVLLPPVDDTELSALSASARLVHDAIELLG